METLLNLFEQPEGNEGVTLPTSTLGSATFKASPWEDLAVAVGSALPWSQPLAQNLRTQQLLKRRQAQQDREALVTGVSKLGDIISSDLPEEYKKYAIGKLGQSLGLSEDLLKPILKSDQDDREAVATFMKQAIEGNPQLNATIISRLSKRDPAKLMDMVLKYREQQQNQQFLQELQGTRPGTLGDTVDAVPRVQGPGEAQIPGGTTVSPQATVTQTTPAGSTVTTAPGQTGVPSTQPGLVTPPGAGAAPTSVYQRVIAEAERQGVPKELALAIVAQESGFNTAARGKAGEIGLFQVLPSTGQTMGYTPEQLADVDTNIRAGMQYLKQQYTRFGGDLRQTISAYNAGPGGVGKNPTYVAEVTARLPGGTGRAPAAATPAAPQADTTALDQQIAGLRAQRRRLEALTPPTTEMANRVNRVVDNLRAEENSLTAERDRVLTRAQTQASHGLAVQRFEAEQQQQRLQQDKQQLEITKLKRELGGEFTPEQHLNLELKVRDNVRQERVSRIFEDASTGYTSVQQGAARGDAQGDYQLINGFARLQNPDSTVMLGEARMVEEAQSLWQQFTQAPDKFFSGNRLKPEVRQKFLDASRDLMERYANRTDALLTQLYGRHARTLNVPVSELIGNPKGILAERAITTRGTGVQTPAAVTTAPPARTMPSSLTGPVEEVR